MSEHRNPRPKVPKRPRTYNPPTQRQRAAEERQAAQDRRELSAAYRTLVQGNPRAASAVLDVLHIVATSDRRRSMALVEAASTVVSSIRGRS